MTEHVDKIEALLRPRFQKNISLFINGEEYKKGKFVLFHSTLLANNFYIEFHIRTEKKLEIIKIPFPFAIEQHIDDEELFYFDYRLRTLCKGRGKLEKELYEFASTQEGFVQNKFFNTILEIQFT
jgi:hypothetical protein